MKIPESKANLATMLLMVLVMTFVVVFVSTAMNHGFQSDFFVRWLKGWGMAIIIAFPTVLIVMPFIKKFVENKTEK